MNYGIRAILASISGGAEEIRIPYLLNANYIVIIAKGSFSFKIEGIFITGSAYRISHYLLKGVVLASKGVKLVIGGKCVFEANNNIGLKIR